VGTPYVSAASSAIPATLMQRFIRGNTGIEAVRLVWLAATAPFGLDELSRSG
jgi:hypothetical protein